MMRSLVLGLFTCAVVISATGQCPVQPGQASIDPSGKNLSIRYYNGGRRAMRAIQFAFTKSDPNTYRSVIATYSVGITLQPKHETTAIFKGWEQDLDLVNA